MVHTVRLAQVIAVSSLTPLSPLHTAPNCPMWQPGVRRRGDVAAHPHATRQRLRATARSPAALGCLSWARRGRPAAAGHLQVHRRARL
eukprot:4578342-Prymnesium_polylepis.1